MDQLLDVISGSGDPPPAPPIFRCDDLDLWPEFFDVETGAEAWRKLASSAIDTTRDAPVVSRAGWEAVLQAEKLRRAQWMWEIDHHADGSLRSEAERSEIRRLDHAACHDFWHWFHRCAWVEDPKASSPDLRVVPMVAWPGQVAYIWWLQQGLDDGIATGRERVQLILKARSAGVSWSVCQILSHRILFERRFAGKVGSLTGKEVDDGTVYSLMGKIRFIWSHQPTYLLPDYPLHHERMEDAIGFVTARVENRVQQSVVRGENMTRNFGRSGRETVLCFDEFAGLSPKLQEEIRTAGTSVAPTTWSISTPKGRGNRFHREFEAAPDDHKLTIRWTVDPRRDSTWYDGLLIEHGGSLTWDQREQEYGCSFAGISGLRIWPHDTDRVAYDEDDPEWMELRDEARRRWLCVCGFDFGDGPSPTFCRYGLVDWAASRPHAEYGRLPRFWWDHEVYGYRTLPADLAPRVLEGMTYGGPWALYGDPAGKQKGHRDLPSWEQDLNHHGVPVLCLDRDPFHQRYFIDKAIELVGELMRLGLWRVHRTRCPRTLTSEEQWAWDVPEGLHIEQVNKAAIPWKKDGPSHACEAGIYGALAVILYHQPPQAPSSESTPMPGQDGLGAELGDIW